MKKVLLLSAAAMLTASAVMAESDITPAGYRYNTGATFRTHPTGAAGANLVINAWETYNCADYWQDGLVMLNGGQVQSKPLAEQTQGTGLVNGISIVDLGGTCGKVLAISGQNSKINDWFASHGYNNPEIPSMTAFPGYFHLNFFLHPQMTPMGGATDNRKIRVRVTLNRYANDLTDSHESDGAIQGHLPTNQCGNPAGTGINMNTGEFIKHYNDDPQEDFEFDGESDYYLWNPERWMVYEFDGWCPENEPGNPANFGPVYFKVKHSNNMTGTLFIRSIEFLEIGAGDNAHATPTKTFVNFTIAPKKSSTGISGISADNDAFGYTIAGNTATFAVDAAIYSVTGARIATAAAGEPTTLASGFYVATADGKSVKFAIR